MASMNMQPKGMKRIMIKSYTKNVAKSLGYAVGDIVTQYNPTIANITKTTAKTSQELYHSTIDLKNFVKGKAAEYLDPKGNNMMSDLIEDLKTGNWYNKEREEKAELAALGLDEEDFGFGDEEDWGTDFDEDESYDAEDDKSSASNSAIDIMENNTRNTKAIVSTIDSATDTLAMSFGKASAQSAQYLAQANSRATTALFNLNKTGFGQVTSLLMNMNNTMTGMVQVSSNLTTHIQNSMMFYTNITESVNKINDKLDTLIKNTSPVEEKRGGSNKKNSLTDFVYDGKLDLESYIDFIKDNIAETKDTITSFSDMVKMMIGEGGHGVSLGKILLKGAIESVIPQQMKDASKNFDNLLNQALVKGVREITKSMSNSDSIILSLLGDMFTPKNNYSKGNQITFGARNRGKVDFDGDTRQAIIEVIPTYLAKMTAAIVGEERYYNYDTGKFEGISSINKRHRDRQAQYAEGIGSEFKRGFENFLENNAEISGKDQVEQMKNFKKLQMGLFKNGRSKDLERLVYATSNSPSDIAIRKKYGVSLEFVKLLNIYKGISDTKASTRYQFGAMENEIFTQRDKFGKDVSEMPDNMRRFTSDDYWRSTNGGVVVLGGLGSNGGAPRIADKERSFVIKQLEEERLGLKRTIESIDESKSYLERMLTDGTKENEKLKAARDEIGKTGVADKIKSFLGTTKSAYEAPFIAISNLVDRLSLGINDVFFGDHQGESLGERIRTHLEEQFKNVKDWFFDLIGAQKWKEDTKGKAKELWNSAKDRATEVLYGKKGAALYREHQDAMKSIKDAAKSKRQKLTNQVADIVSSYGDSDSEGGEPEQLAFGRAITKSGLAVLSKGELVIPSELNPYYHGVTNKRQQIIDENNIARRFLGTFAEGNLPNFKKMLEDTRYTYEVEGNTWYIIDPYGNKVEVDAKLGKNFANARRALDKIKKLDKLKAKQENDERKSWKDWLKNNRSNYNGEGEYTDDNGVRGLINDSWNTFQSGIKKAFNAMLGKDQDPEKVAEETQTKLTDSIKDTLEETGNHRGAIAIGAIAGLGTSLLTGAFIGPIAGAALGAGVGLIADSQKFQEKLFGKKDEKGEYSGGLLPEGFTNSLMKFLPSLKAAGIGGGAGALISTLITGNPVLGLFVGSGVGFAAKSESFNNFLFGEPDGEGNRYGGLIPKEFLYKIKRALPNIAIGAGVGALAGPFGMVGNLIAGSALGFATSTDRMQKWLYGDGTEENKGIFGKIHDKIVKNIDTIFHNLSNSIKGWLSKTGKSITASIHKWIEDARDNAKKGKGGLLSRTVGTVINSAAWLGDTLTNGAINLVGNPLEWLAKKTTKRNLYSGYDTYSKELGRNLTNEEKIQMMGGADKAIKDKFGRVYNAIQSRDDLANINAEINAAGNDKKAISAVLEKYGMSGIKGADVFTAKSLISKGIADKEKSKSGEQKATEKLTEVYESKTNKIVALIDGIYAHLTGRQPSTPEGLAQAGKILAKKQNKNGKNYYYTVDKATGKRIASVTSDQALSLLGEDEFNASKDEQEVRYEFDFMGNPVKLIKDTDGEWKKDTSDKETAASAKIMSKFTEDIGGIGIISSSITGMKDMFTNWGEKLFGKDDDKKEEGFFSKLLNGKSLASVVSNLLLDSAVIAAATALLTGALDPILSKLPGFGKGNKGGGDTQEATLSDGTKVYKKNGKWVDANGNAVDVKTSDLYNHNIKTADVKSASENAWSALGHSIVYHGTTKTINAVGKGLSRVPVVGKAGVVRGMANFTKAGVMDDVARFIANLLNEIAKNPIGGKQVAKLFETSTDEVTTKILGKNTDDFARALSKVLSERFDDTVLAGISANAGAIKLATAVIDFTSGYEDARATLGIVDEPTIPQRFLAGFVRVLKNLLLVTAFIPDSVYVDIVEKALEMVGIKTGLSAQRQKALNIVAKYNQRTGENIDVQQYVKREIGDRSWTERVGDTVKSTFADVKSDMANIKEYGIAGFLTDKVDTINEAMMGASGKNGLEKFFNGLSAGFSSVLPGLLGDFLAAKTNIWKYATQGDYLRLWLEELPGYGTNDNAGMTEEGVAKATPGIFSYIIGQVPLFVTKTIASVYGIPFLIQNKIIKPIIDKNKEAFDNFTNAGKNVFANAMNGSLIDLWGTENEDSEGNPLGMASTVLLSMEKLLLTPINLQMTLNRTITGFITDKVITPAKDAANLFSSSYKDLMDTVYNTDGTEKLGDHILNFDDVLNENDSPINGFNLGIVAAGKIAVLPVIAAKIAAHRVGNFISSIVDPLKKDYDDFKTFSSTALDIGKTGDSLDSLGQLWSTPYNATSLLGGQFNGLAIGEKLYMSVPVAYRGVAKVATKAFNDYLVIPVKSDYSEFQTYHDTMMTIIAGGSGNVEKDTEDILNSSYEGYSPISLALNPISKIEWFTATSFTALRSVADGLRHKVSDLIDPIKSDYDKLTTFNDEIADEAANVSSWGDLIDNVLGKEYHADSLLGGLFGIPAGMSRITYAGFSTFKLIGNSLSDQLEKRIAPIKDDYKTISSTLDEMAKLSNDGKPSDVFLTTAEFKSPISGVFKTGLALGRTFYGIFGLVNNIVNHIGESVTKLKNSDGWTILWDTVQKLVQSSSGTTTDNSSAVASGGSSYVNQFDPRYNGLSIDGNSFASRGCGPAVASMAAAANGKNLSVGNAVALSKAFQNPDGVSADYFRSALASQGIDTTYYGGNSLASDIAMGKNAILLGRDPFNTSKANSPFGPGNHYVLATGYDRNGNVIINDPEQSGPRAYNPNILNSVSVGISTSNRGGRSGLARRFRRISAGGQSEAQNIWAFFKGKGLSEYAVAGILGNFHAESGCMPAIVQGHKYKSWNDAEYTQAVDNGTHSRSSFAHDSKGYGLAQWTSSGRKEALYDYAKSKGTSIGNLATQLEYAWMEMSADKGFLNKLNNAKSVYDATYIMCKSYERPADQSETAIRRRSSYGESYYTQFTGKQIQYNGSTGGNDIGTFKFDKSDWFGGERVKPIPTNMTFNNKEELIRNLHYISQSQYGVYEGGTNSPKKEGNNHQPYGIKYHNPNDMWCASFTTWAYDQAVGGDAKKLSDLTYGIGGQNGTNGVRYWRNAFEKAGQFNKTPQVGDAVIWKGHIGIVDSIDADGTVHTIEGNFNQHVGSRAIKYPYNDVIGFGHPNWEAAGLYPGKSGIPGTPTTSGTMGSVNSFGPAIATTAATAANANSSSSSGSDNGVFGVISKVMSAFSNAFNNLFAPKDNTSASQTITGTTSDTSTMSDIDTGYTDDYSYNSSFSGYNPLITSSDAGHGRSFMSKTEEIAKMSEFYQKNNHMPASEANKRAEAQYKLGKRLVDIDPEGYKKLDIEKMSAYFQNHDHLPASAADSKARQYYASGKRYTDIAYDYEISRMSSWYGSNGVHSAEAANKQAKAAWNTGVRYSDLAKQVKGTITSANNVRSLGYNSTAEAERRKALRSQNNSIITNSLPSTSSNVTTDDLISIALGRGSGISSYNELALASGGSSGLLLKSRVGSRVNSNRPINSMATSNAAYRNSRRNSGGASVDSIPVTFSRENELIEYVKKIANKADLIEKNTAILDAINKIIAEYNRNHPGTSGGDSNIPKPAKKSSSNTTSSTVNNNDQIDPSVSGLIGMLAQIAKG